MRRRTLELVDPRAGAPPTSSVESERAGPASGPVLLVVFGAPEPELGRRIVVGDELLIGRDDARFEGLSRSLSRRHAQLRRAGGALLVRDLDSRFGTFVNGVRTHRAVTLGVGDLVTAGKLGLLVTSAPSEFLPTPDGALAHESFALDALLRDVRAAADAPLPVHLHGEPGVGKRALATELHRARGASGRLRVVEGPAPPDDPFGPADTCLFPYLELASPRVLDECATLLRAAARGRPTPRIVITTEPEAAARLPDRVEAHLGAVVRRSVPPLRERREDVLPIARAVLARLAGRAVAIGSRLARHLLAQRFPGNVRDLEAELGWRLRRHDGGAPPAVLELDEDPASSRGWLVAADGSFFETPDAERTYLGGRRVLSTILCALAEAHARDVELDVDALAARAWPGERILASARAGRVHVAIATLRRLGLGPILTRGRDGYRLAPALTVVLT